jgi:hypothetical protein
MKIFAIVSVLAFSFSSFAGVTLKGRMEKVNCLIKDNQVTRTQTFGKDGLSFTSHESISTTGLEETLRTAEGSVTERPSDPDFEFQATVDGRTFRLHTMDSKAATSVIQLLVKACRI